MISAAPLSRDRAIIRVAAIILILAFLSAARVYNPFELELLRCRFKDLTGYDCPTCGLSRSVYCLLSFDIVDSIGYHPLGVVLVVWLLVLLVKFTCELITGKEYMVDGIRFSCKGVVIIILVVVFIAWILRLYLN